MANTILLDTCKIPVKVIYDWDELVLLMVKQHDLDGTPQSDRIYDMWNTIITDLKARSASTYVEYIDVVKVEGVIKTEYYVVALEDALRVIDVSIEGQAIDETDENLVTINLETSTVTFGIDLAEGARIKIEYVK